MVLWTNIGASSSNFVLSLLIVIIDLLCFFSFGAQSQVPAGRTRAPVSSRVTADTNRSTRLLSPWNTTISTRRPAEFRRNVSPPQRITLAEEKGKELFTEFFELVLLEKVSLLSALPPLFTN